MRLTWLTDLHLDHLDNNSDLQRFGEKVRAEKPEAVVITGDISRPPYLEVHLRRLVAEFGCNVYFVLGNHDFYHSSIATVRERIGRFCRDERKLHWLDQCGPVQLTERSVLVGVGGWNDTRFGDWEGSPVVLNDYLLIHELDTRQQTIDSLRRKLMELADDAAHMLAQKLSAAVPGNEVVYIATHVPPFQEACWHEGKMSSPDYLPHFASRATGEVILEVAKKFPNKRFEVWCGHTHSGGVVEVLPNLTVKTAGAKYGDPVVAETMEVE